MSYNAHDLSNRLLNALDNNYNVVDMQAVNEIISILEKFNITKELLETTRLGKHVNELRRKTSEPTLARRAKVLVKRWRDLVIPSVTSPGHTGSNRSSAERQVRRLGGTPLTSPALSRVVSPAVNSPRTQARPAWGGYESDSQDVILVDNEPAPPAAHKPLTPPVKRPVSPAPVHDEKKTKRDKKPKKRRGHSRAGAGTETPAAGPPPPGAPAPAPALAAAPTAAGAGAWPARNGKGLERRRNGYKREQMDAYTALVHRMPPAGAKKVKTTKELLEEIQSRGARPAASPSPPGSPDVMLVETDDYPVKKVSPLRNGGVSPRVPSPGLPAAPPPPLEDYRPHYDCTCGEGEDSPQCPANGGAPLRPRHVHALHHGLLPGINGTRAPPLPHKFAVRKPEHPDWPGLFASVVPLYRYSDYADDYCAKNLSCVNLCPQLPWREFAPPPPSPPPLPAPPSPRPYPLEEPAEVKAEPDPPPAPDPPKIEPVFVKIGPEPVGATPFIEASERLKAPILSDDEERNFGRAEPVKPPKVEAKFASELQEHRTVEKTKVYYKTSSMDGKTLIAHCETARAAVPWDYEQLASAPEIAPDIAPADPEAEAEAEAALQSALELAAADTSRDALGRPNRAVRFAEWHECAELGDLVALPYVVID